jgi:hypothetical protein
MDTNLRYVISEQGGDEFPFDRADYRAYFYWVEDGVARARSYSVEELEAHIEDCKARGASTRILEGALRRLRAMNR